MLAAALLFSGHASQISHLEFLSVGILEEAFTRWSGWIEEKKVGFPLQI